jgi:hypothetical protein
VSCRKFLLKREGYQALAARWRRRQIYQAPWNKANPVLLPAFDRPESAPWPKPAVYTHKGKQYVVFAAGGNGIVAPRASDQLVAFALP